MPELILNQHEFVAECLSRYRNEPPAGRKFHQAHYPLSKEAGGKTTIQLLPEDHAVQGLLQSLDLGIPCIYPGDFKRESELIAKHYPEYLDLYWEVYKFAQSYAGSQTVKQGAGIHDAAHSEKVAEGRKKGGATMGAKCKEQGKGIFDPKFQNPLMKARTTRKGGIATMQARKGIFAMSAEERASAGRKGAQSLNSQRWQSLHDGFVSTAGGVASHNKALGVPVEFKVRVAN
jgi:hypothetical protein